MEQSTSEQIMSILEKGIQEGFALGFDMAWETLEPFVEMAVSGVIGAIVITSVFNAIFLNVGFSKKEARKYTNISTGIIDWIKGR